MHIDNIDVTKEGYRVKQQHQNDLLPSIEHITSGNIPGFPGERYVRTDIGAKEINFEVRLPDDGDMELKAEAFKRKFFDDKGQPKETLIRFPYSPRDIKVYINNSMPVNREGAAGTFQVSVVQFDPFQYDPDSVTTATDFPKTIFAPQWMHPTPAHFSFEFSAATSDFRLTHLGQDRYIRLIDQSFAIGDTLTIDMINEVVHLNGQRINNKLTFESDFFMLESGENEINVNTEGELTVEYAPRYL